MQETTEQINLDHELEKLRLTGEIEHRRRQDELRYMQELHSQLITMYEMVQNMIKNQISNQ